MIHQHIPKIVDEIRGMYFDILTDKNRFKTVQEFCSVCVDASYQNYKDGYLTFATEFRHYNKKYARMSDQEVAELELTIDDFRDSIASAYTFDGWDDMVNRDQKFDPLFETAIDWLLVGEFKKLIQLIISNPKYLIQKSPFGHQAGLIHYCGSNGVEIWRQVVPENLPQILYWLIQNGADPHQENNIYRMNSSLRGLIETSAHPHQAGIVNDLIEVLESF